MASFQKAVSRVSLNHPIFPKCQAENVDNWQELWVKKSGGKVELSCATAAIFNYIPAVGVTKLTADNVADAWRRIVIIEALRGSLIVYSKTQKPLFVTRTDIERHIGTQIEGAKRSFKQFCNEIISWGLSSDHKKLPSFIANGNATMLELSGVANLSRIKKVPWKRRNFPCVS